MAAASLFSTEQTFVVQAIEQFHLLRSEGVLRRSRVSGFVLINCRGKLPCLVPVSASLVFTHDRVGSVRGIDPAAP